MQIKVTKQVLQIGTRFIAEIRYERIVATSRDDSIFRCPYKALAELTEGLLEFLDEQK